MEPEMKRAASQPTMIIMCVAARKGQQKHKARERESTRLPHRLLGAVRLMLLFPLVKKRKERLVYKTKTPGREREITCFILGKIHHITL